MAGMMQYIKKYLRSHYGVIRAPLVYIMRKTITIQTFGNQPKHAIPDNKMITRLLYLSPNKNKLHSEQSTLSVKEYVAEQQ